MSEHSDEIAVEVSLPCERLDIFLHQRFACVSRTALRRLITAGEIVVNGRRVKPSHHPQAGEIVTVRWPAPRPATVQPRAIPLDILYEDEALLVLNKPAGMVVHPAGRNQDNTLVNALLHHCQGQLSGIGGIARPGIVHRLDQHTSGLLVVAKSDAVHVALSTQFANREVQKVYHALVCGQLMPPAGEINAAIARHPSHRKLMAVLQGGRSALTTYRVIERLREATLVEARLRTGRTHQARVHFKYIGFPLVGDTVYGKRQNARLRELTGFTAPRQMLHAHFLAFIHPLTREPLAFTAPWPEDFKAAVMALKN
jgi:23S rRNA pseudouridine1911/1915/1917 synthase